MFWRAQRSLVKPFEPSSWAAAFDGPKTLMPAARRSSAMPATSGASGPTTTRSIDLSLAEGGDGRVVGDIERDQFGFLGDARIAGRGVELGQHRRRRELPGQRMLAATGPDEKNVHAASTCLWKPLASGMAACAAGQALL